MDDAAWKKEMRGFPTESYRNGSKTLMKNVSKSDALIWNHITKNEK